MTSFLKTEGVVLKARSVGEADRLVTVFTREAGKLVVKAVGVRKINSKKAAVLEPFNQVKVMISDYKGFYYLKEASLIESFKELKANLYRLTQASQVLEVVDKLTQGHEDVGAIYARLIDLLIAINQASSTKQQILDYYCFLSSELGFGLPSQSSELALSLHLNTIMEKPIVSKKYLLAEI